MENQPNLYSAPFWAHHRGEFLEYAHLDNNDIWRDTLRRHQQELIARRALFEMAMTSVDNGEISREEAIEGVAALVKETIGGDHE